MFSLRTGALLLALTLVGAQPAPTAAPYTVLSAEGRRPLPARVVSGQDMVSLEDLANLFHLTVREDSLAGGITVTGKAQTIVLTPGQSLATVAGLSLPLALIWLLLSLMLARQHAHWAASPERRAASISRAPAGG